MELQQVKCYPPLEKIPSFISNAIILSYTGYAEEINTIMNLLSQNSRIYLKSHESILGDFLKKEPPMYRLDKVLAFTKTMRFERQICYIDILERKLNTEEEFIQLRQYLFRIRMSLNNYQLFRLERYLKSKLIVTDMHKVDK